MELQDVKQVETSSHYAMAHAFTLTAHADVCVYVQYICVCVCVCSTYSRANGESEKLWAQLARQKPDHTMATIHTQSNLCGDNT